MGVSTCRTPCGCSYRSAQGHVNISVHHCCHCHQAASSCSLLRRRIDWKHRRYSCTFRQASMLLAYSLARSPPHPPARSLARSLGRSPTHPPTHSLTHSLIHSLTHSLARSLTHPLTQSIPAQTSICRPDFCTIRQTSSALCLMGCSHVAPLPVLAKSLPTLPARLLT